MDKNNPIIINRPLPNNLKAYNDPHLQADFYDLYLTPVNMPGAGPTMINIDDVTPPSA